MNDHKFFYVCGNSWIPKYVLGELPIPQMDYLLSYHEGKKKGIGNILLKKGDIHNVIDTLFIDSGMFSAFSNGSIEWIHKTDGCIQFAKKMSANICAMMDVPSYTDGSSEFFNSKESLDLTAKNARVFKEHGDIGMDKCYVLQGYDKKGYKKCIENYDKIDIWSDADYIGVGSIAKQKKADIIKIANYIIPAIQDRTDAKIHFFGIGSPSLVVKLFDMGVYSSDSASLIRRSFQYESIMYKGKPSYPDKTKFDQHIFKYLYIFNVLIHNRLIFDWADENQTSLFEYAGEEVSNEVCDIAASNNDHKVMEEFVPSFLPGDVL